MHARDGSFWTDALLISGGLFILFRYGLTQKPLPFNYFNPWKKPLPVWAARVVYIPMAVLFLYYGLLNMATASR